MLLDVQDCLALLSVSEACIKSTWMEHLGQDSVRDCTSFCSPFCLDFSPVSRECEKKVGAGDKRLAAPQGGEGEEQEEKKEAVDGETGKTDQTKEKKGETSQEGPTCSGENTAEEKRDSEHRVEVPQCCVPVENGRRTASGVRTRENSSLDFTSRPVKRDSVFYMRLKDVQLPGKILPGGREEGQESKEERLLDGETEMTLWDHFPGSAEKVRGRPSQRIKQHCQER